MPTRNKNGCIVMVEYDHLLLEHLRAGHKVDSFDTRKLRRRPAQSPRERWLCVQDHLLAYDVIDDSLFIPTWQARTRRSPSPQASSSRSKRRKTPARESSANQVSNSPATANIAETRPSGDHPSLSPKRSAGEIPPAKAVEASNSKVVIDPSSVEPSACPALVRTSLPARRPLPTGEIVNAPDADWEPAPPSTLADEPVTASIAALPSLEVSPCSVSSPPHSSSPPRLPSSTEAFPSSSASGSTTNTDPKGDPNLALFDEAIYLCRRFVKLVEESRNKRREAAESRREGGGQ